MSWTPGTKADTHDGVTREVGRANRADAVAKWDAENRELAKVLGQPEPPPTPVKRGRPPNWLVKRREVVAAKALMELRRRLDDPEHREAMTNPDLIAMGKLDGIDKTAQALSESGPRILVIDQRPSRKTEPTVSGEVVDDPTA